MFNAFYIEAAAALILRGAFDIFMLYLVRVLEELFFHLRRKRTAIRFMNTGNYPFSSVTILR